MDVEITLGICTLGFEDPERETHGTLTRALRDVIMMASSSFSACIYYMDL